MKSVKPAGPVSMLMRSTPRLRHKRIFIDSSAWIAYMLKGEPNHQAVFDYLTGEIRLKSKLFTSDYVLDETFTRLLNTQGITTVKKFKTHLSLTEKQGQLLVFWTDETLFTRSWPLFQKFAEHKLSFTDVTIFTLAKDFKLDEVLSLDQGFKKVGLTVRPLL